MAAKSLFSSRVGRGCDDHRLGRGDDAGSARFLGRRELAHHGADDARGECGFAVVRDGKP